MDDWGGLENHCSVFFRTAGSNPAPAAMISFFKKTKKESKSFKEVLERIKKLEKSFGDFSQEFKKFKEISQKNLQKIGIVRFNPFKEIGGDQSFSIAILDKNNDGVVITSHYGQALNRVYAKPIHRGQSKYQLSQEEKRAIEKAIKNF